MREYKIGVVLYLNKRLKSHNDRFKVYCRITFKRQLLRISTNYPMMSDMEFAQADFSDYISECRSKVKKNGIKGFVLNERSEAEFTKVQKSLKKIPDEFLIKELQRRINGKESNIKQKCINSKI